MNCALVTGGSRGIGRAICYKMAAMGYYVLVNYKGNIDEANNTLAQIRENGGDGELLQFNVADKNDIQQKLGGWIETNTEKYIEVLINNAGVKDDGLMMWMTDQQWDGVINTSLSGFFYVTRLVLNGMLVKKYGRIVNVVSLSGLKGLPGQVNYSAAKAGVIGATKALAQEVGRRGITVNAVAPGFIATDMTAGLDEKELKAMVPLKRFGTPEEVAHAVGFLASPEAAYITAEVLSINGGLYS
ncbi:3-oxoacyl-ACP reductase FabG [Mucilaginibacter rubeus]|uniref:3-oxoacyl-ACP reductase FabG n=1 Tax=Mucilaginibacter rubeus TaxID=2027860 RepID=A0AAE6JJU2_9SPHI|nr:MULTISPECIES: 3-oxoacyl-ACP reductase FabG [Mucilaginibacter]QEM06733.1 3-oxoacyl-ACP reductase FabG [Mucilaginibacter rubeus]QEM19321.1 3-oxoacyl-ACP reductase FabG [Mucilaginibacter gossypii]QTE44135.1 3-oxoacyl-ACP reductase FabG [Mucilaginibacter rubeus]QTE50736.1 3-oxoacyl-ACP reductase FabG [Mucilaginibacter rubeus]QTE55818.1 3-oxoacyl-ACP reductase FabG [Mucilaginibacter rubeus]